MIDRFDEKWHTSLSTITEAVRVKGGKSDSHRSHVTAQPKPLALSCLRVLSPWHLPEPLLYHSVFIVAIEY